jgi:hypothetical protein
MATLNTEMQAEIDARAYDLYAQMAHLDDEKIFELIATTPFDWRAVELTDEEVAQLFL